MSLAQKTRAYQRTNSALRGATHNLRTSALVCILGIYLWFI
jgi:hypothetical protein